ncbi:hypothetical protein Q5H93_10410 [Hymenobacter sp. ASUV-10]|uniref:DUF4276 family protein n=1 Tax=Hymenobacter aranciens TaxID=3063996 RepID=A0ABT9BA52_9BACT|nr:hypothetical protein [Hymenobacter sp. ASUV-10]MDO7875144.1 hypothetical protein [Hymenobacter sp. ASUV-10]
MSIITYGFFGEDKGQGRFLTEYLRKMETLHPVLFDAHPWFSQKYQGVNNKGVDKGFREAWLRGFGQECELDCLFVGRDLDSNTPTIRAERHQVFIDKVAGIDRPNWWARTVFILPMQCIEHWLLALQRRADGRPSKDTRDLEGILNDAVKRELYEEHPRTPTNQSKDDLVTALAADLDIEWLAGVSVSFQDFHQQVEAYLAKHLVA